MRIVHARRCCSNTLFGGLSWNEIAPRDRVNRFPESRHVIQSSQRRSLVCQNVELPLQRKWKGVWPPSPGTSGRYRLLFSNDVAGFLTPRACDSGKRAGKAGELFPVTKLIKRRRFWLGYWIELSCGQVGLDDLIMLCFSWNPANDRTS